MTITLSVLDETPIRRQTSVLPQPTEADGRRDVGRRRRTRPSAGTFSRRSAESSCPLPGARRDNASSMSPAGRVSPRSPRRCGREVVASDNPERLEVGRIEAARRGAVIDWAVGDPEALPYASQSFDSVVSCLGVMFERHHQTAAKELLRMTTLGGRIGLLSGTPRASGPAGGPRQPHPPDTADASAGADPLGRRGIRINLLGDRVTSVGASRQRHEVDRFANPREFRDFARHGYGPTSAAYRKLAGRPDRVAELDHAVVDLARDHMTRRGLMQWEYLLLTAHRAG